MNLLQDSIRRLFQAREIIKYVIAGGLAFLVDAGLLKLITHIYGEEVFLLANTVGFACGLLVSYLLNIKWVFADRKYGDRVGLEFPLFVTIVGGGYLILQLMMWVFVSLFSMDLMVAKVAASFLLMVYNFLAKKLLLFTKQS